MYYQCANHENCSWSRNNYFIKKDCLDPDKNLTLQQQCHKCRENKCPQCNQESLYQTFDWYIDTDRDTVISVCIKERHRQASRALLRQQRNQNRNSTSPVESSTEHKKRKRSLDGFDSEERFRIQKKQKLDNVCSPQQKQQEQRQRRRSYIPEPELLSSSTVGSANNGNRQFPNSQIKPSSSSRQLTQQEIERNSWGSYVDWPAFEDDHQNSYASSSARQAFLSTQKAQPPSAPQKGSNILPPQLQPSSQLKRPDRKCWERISETTSRCLWSGCNSRFSNKEGVPTDDVFDHIRSMHGVEPLKCWFPGCANNERITDVPKFKRHMCYHHNIATNEKNPLVPPPPPSLQPPRKPQLPRPKSQCWIRISATKRQCIYEGCTPKDFSSKRNCSFGGLYRHIRLVHKVDPFKCFFADCPHSESFHVASELEKHMRDYHNFEMTTERPPSAPQQPVPSQQNKLPSPPSSSTTFLLQLPKKLYLPNSHLNLRSPTLPQLKRPNKQCWAYTSGTTLRCLWPGCHSKYSQAGGPTDVVLKHIEEVHKVDPLKCWFPECSNNERITDVSKFKRHMYYLHGITEFTPEK